MFPLKPGNTKLPRNKAKNAESHTQPVKFGMGDFYGSGAKNPMGRIRDGSTVGYRPVNPKQLKTPPKSVV